MPSPMIRARFDHVRSGGASVQKTLSPSAGWDVGNRDDRRGADHACLEGHIATRRCLHGSGDPRSQARAEDAGATVPVGPRDDDTFEQLDVTHGVRRDRRFGENALGSGREY